MCFKRWELWLVTAVSLVVAVAWQRHAHALGQMTGFSFGLADKLFDAELMFSGKYPVKIVERLFKDILGPVGFVGMAAGLWLAFRARRWCELSRRRRVRVLSAARRRRKLSARLLPARDHADCGHRRRARAAALTTVDRRTASIRYRHHALVLRPRACRLRVFRPVGELPLVVQLRRGFRSVLRLRQPVCRCRGPRCLRRQQRPRAALLHGSQGLAADPGRFNRRTGETNPPGRREARDRSRRAL